MVRIIPPLLTGIAAGQLTYWSKSAAQMVVDGNALIPISVGVSIAALAFWFGQKLRGIEDGISSLNTKFKNLKCQECEEADKRKK